MKTKFIYSFNLQTSQYYNLLTKFTSYSWLILGQEQNRGCLFGSYKSIFSGNLTDIAGVSNCT